MSQRMSLTLPQLPELGQTSRLDRWWLQPVLVLCGLMAFIIYSTWAAFQGEHYFLPGTNYLSPMYSPLLFESWKVTEPSHHAWFGPWPEWLPKTLLFIPLTPALLILWMPGGFRFTCYYYRGAYYKAFWADPLNCSVGEPGFRQRKYRGERWFPLTIQNVHRYFLYIAIAFIFFLSWDAFVSYIWPSPGGGNEFGIGIGSIVLTLNPMFLGAYTLGCHSLRHIIGGRKDTLGTGAGRTAYDCVSCLNRRHMMWAWISLFWVGFTDLYVRLCSMGIWTDWRLI